MNTNQTPQKPSRNRPGAMTVAMQAAQEKAIRPKALRIGVIQGGKIVEERIFRKCENIAAGSSEKNHFVIHGEGVPARFKLFRFVGKSYVLNYTETMKGRLGLSTGVHDLDAMRLSGTARNADGRHQVKLNEESHGCVTIGNTTLLFQFIVPPPLQPRPQLPAAVRGGLVENIDWTFTALVAFTLMSMLSFIVYLENADWPVERGLAKVPLDFAEIIFQEPIPIEQTMEREIVDESDGERIAESEGPAREPTRKSIKSDGRPSVQSVSTIANKKAQILEEAVQTAETLLVGALSSDKSGALDDVLAPGAVIGNAEDILTQARGIGVAKRKSSGELRPRTGGESGSGQKGLGALAATVRTETGIRTEEVKEREILPGRATLGEGADIGGTGEFDSKVVVRTIRRGLNAIRACYERELRRNPMLAGKVTVQFSIQPQGNVTDSKIIKNTTGETAVANCVLKTIRRFRFIPGPEGGSVAYSYPFVFAPQN